MRSGVQSNRLELMVKGSGSKEVVEEIRPFFYGAPPGVLLIFLSSALSFNATEKEIP